MKKYSKKLTTAILVFAVVFSLGAWTPEKKPVGETVSKSCWIWTADKPVADGAIACFRQNFDLPAAVESAVFRVNYDDGGALWVNGKACPHRNLKTTRIYEPAKWLKPGKNTLAVQVKNGKGPAGFLLFGEIKLVNGTTVYIHSTADTKSISGPLNEKWFLPEYDDSKWGKSRVLGDVLAAPWNRFLDFKNFLTPEETQKYKGPDAKQ